MSDDAYQGACDAHSTRQLPEPLASLDRARAKLVGGVMNRVLSWRHPGTLQTLPRPLELPEATPCARLRPADDLVPSRYGWPAQDFSEENSVKGEFGTEPWLSLRAGDSAVDFTLSDQHGHACHLGTLLATKPVVLTFGMYTCPAYQMSKQAECELASTYADQVHFLHLYTLEPHPKGSNAPDIGAPWELHYSTYPQPESHAERIAMRALILADHPPTQHVLLDDLSPGHRVNPVWSTYGPAPRPGFLIRQDGLIDTSQLWFNASHLEGAILQLLS